MNPQSHLHAAIEVLVFVCWYRTNRCGKVVLTAREETFRQPLYVIIIFSEEVSEQWWNDWDRQETFVDDGVLHTIEPVNLL